MVYSSQVRITFLEDTNYNAFFRTSEITSLKHNNKCCKRYQDNVFHGFYYFLIETKDIPTIFRLSFTSRSSLNVKFDKENETDGGTSGVKYNYIFNQSYGVT